MPCCGQKRRRISRHSDHRLPNTLSKQNQFPVDPKVTRSQERLNHAKPAVSLTYMGSSKLIVIGPFTGRRYVFSESGAQVSVDYRDAGSLMQLKQLVRTEEKSNSK